MQLWGPLGQERVDLPGGFPAHVPTGGSVVSDLVAYGIVARGWGGNDRHASSIPIVPVLSAQQLEHSLCAALHLQITRGSVLQAVNRVQ